VTFDIHEFLTLALDMSERAISRFGHFVAFPRKSWMGPRAGLEVETKEKMSAPAGNQYLVVQSVANQFFIV
jgi:hypothetical protein